MTKISKSVGVKVCKDCDGKGVLLKSIRHHSFNNPHCEGPHCKALLVDICSTCNGHKKFSWIDQIIRKKPDLEVIFNQSLLKEIEMITQKKVRTISLSVDVPGSVCLATAISLASKEEKNARNL